MIRELTDIVLNIIIPLACLLYPSLYIYRGGRFLYGVLGVWGVLIAYEFTSFLAGGLAYHFLPNYLNLFEQGPGVAAMILLGWVPGIVISVILKLIRYAVAKARSSNLSL